MNVVSIMAHQDDEMRCLGTMLRCRQRGDHLVFITLTDGSKGFVQRPEIPRDEAGAIRHAEMADLAHQAGGEFIGLGEPDEFLYDTAELRLRLIEAIRRSGAELVLTHFEQDYNLDHTTTSLLVRHCCMQSCLNVLPTATKPLRAHPAVFMVEPIGAFAFAPSHFVDITPCQVEKERLMSCHRSQEEAFRSLTGEGLGVLCRRPAEFWGEHAGCRFAEAFVPMRGRGSIKPFNVLP